MPRSDIFHPDFQPRPYWWEAYAPAAGELAEVPREARVAIVGGGYAGLAAALELAKHGVAAVVLERGAPGIGASTRNGGSVSGGVNIGKSFTGRSADVEPERAERLLEEHRVAVAPGEGFGPSGAGWARLSLAVSDDTLERGIERLAPALAAAVA